MNHETPASLKEFVFFHTAPDHRWDAESTKSLLLFFDGIATMTTFWEREQWDYDHMALPLEDLGLFYCIQPERVIDESIASALADLVAGAAERGELTPLHERSLRGAILSQFRIGSYIAPDIAQMLIEKLQGYGLVSNGPPPDLWSLEVQPNVRDLIYCALPHLLRERAEGLGLSLFPIEASGPSSAAGPSPSETILMLRRTVVSEIATLVMLDAEDVVPDLSSVPLDEILDFRNQHGKSYRAYSRKLRAFTFELSSMPTEVRLQAISLRREELREEGEDLKRLARSSWQVPAASFSLGGAGATLAASQGNWMGAGISLATALLGLKRRTEPATAFTYLYDVKKEFERPHAAAKRVRARPGEN